MVFKPASLLSSHLALVAVVLPTLFLLSCGKDTPTNCPDFDIGAVEGYVLVSGEGLSTHVRARALEGPEKGLSLWDVEADSSGWYRLELPMGLYRLELGEASENSWHYSNDMRDTLRVTRTVKRHDLLRGRMEIRLEMPPHLADEPYNLWVDGGTFDTENQRTTVQDGALLYSFPALNPGSYTMRLSGHGTGWRFYLPGTTDSQEAHLLQVSTTAVAAYDLDLSQDYASISGRVTGSWELSDKDHPRLIVVSPDSLELGTTRCSADGSFVVGLLKPETIHLQIQDGYREIRQWVGGDSFATSRVFNLAPGDLVTGVEVMGTGLQIQLTGPGETLSHRPSLLIIDAAGEQHRLDHYSSDNLDICNLRPGRHFLQVNHNCENDRWAPQWFSGTEIQAEATPIDLVAGELRLIEIELVEGGNIEGAVLTVDGERPEFAQIMILDHQGQPLCQANSPWQWRPDGLFQFRGLANGTYFLATRGPDYEPWYYPGTSDFAAAAPLVITDHQTFTDITWSLPSATKAGQK